MIVNHVNHFMKHSQTEIKQSDFGGIRSDYKKVALRNPFAWRTLVDVDANPRLLQVLREELPVKLVEKGVEGLVNFHMSFRLGWPYVSGFYVVVNFLTVDWD
jgi:hypothetical protein